MSTSENLNFRECKNKCFPIGMSQEQPFHIFVYIILKLLSVFLLTMEEKNVQF